MEHSVRSYVCAGLSLLGVPGLLSVAQESDFDWLLRVQAGLAGVPVNELSQRESECHTTTKIRRGYLREKTIVSLVWVVSAIAIACIALYPRFEITTITTQQMFSIASVTAFSWGTLGRLGWTEKSYKGSTIYERLDTFLFWVLYWVGTLCGVLAVVNV